MEFTLLQILLLVASLTIILSSVIIILVLFEFIPNGKIQAIHFLIKNKKNINVKYKIIYYTCLISAMVAIYSFWYNIFWFIPESWGGIDEYGEFSKIKDSIVILLFGLSVISMFKYIESCIDKRFFYIDKYRTIFLDRLINYISNHSSIDYNELELIKNSVIKSLDSNVYFYDNFLIQNKNEIYSIKLVLENYFNDIIKNLKRTP